MITDFHGARKSKPRIHDLQMPKVPKMTKIKDVYHFIKKTLIIGKEPQMPIVRITLF